MKEHLQRFWLHYFVLGILVFFIYKLIKDNNSKRRGSSNGEAPSSIDVNKQVCTSTSYSEEVKTIQQYVNANMLVNGASLQPPLVIDGYMDINTSYIIDNLQLFNNNEPLLSNDGYGSLNRQICTSVNEVISLVSNWNNG